MATRLQCQFESFHGQTYRIDIDDADYVGSPLEIDVADNGFSLKYSGKTDRVVPGIMGSSCAVSVAVTPGNRTALDTLADDIRNSEETRFSIAIYKIEFGPTENLFWAGTVLTDLGGFDDIGNVFFFTIEAVDGLARLKNIDYKDTSLTPDGPYGNLSFINHLLNCLFTVSTTATYWSGTDVFLRTVVNWQEAGHGSIAANKCPLKYSRVHGRVFAKERLNAADEDWEFSDMYKTVEAICEHWGARLMLSDGSWRFEQVRERLEETFYERRWDSLDETGNLLSSTATAGYDHNIIQASTTDFRTSGGQFNYLPALRHVEVNYKHNTYVNQVAGQYYRWQKDSGYDQTYTVTGISFDADSFFKVSGVLNLECSTTFVDIDDRWRAIFGVLLRLPDGPYRFRSHTSVTQVGPNAPVYNINHEPYTWTSTDSGIFYEISSQVATSSKIKTSIPFEFWTPYVPSGQTSFSINFASQIRGEYIIDSSPATLTLTDWFFEDLVLTINGLDVSTNYETDRIYKPTNTDTGNSDAIKIDSIFGHAVKGWTPCKVQVTSDLATWTDAAATWDRGTETSNDEFGELLANQLLRLQQLPVQTYSGELIASPVAAHERITFTDLTTWLITNATFQAAKDQWSVEMVNTGVADAGTITTIAPGKIIKGPQLPRVTKWGLVAAPSDGTGFDTTTGTSTRIGLDAAAVNIVRTTITAGTITSIPVQYNISGGTFQDGDYILIHNPQSGNVVAFEVDGDQSAGSNSINVVSQVTTVDIPIGSEVFYPLHNIYTQNTGGGGYGTGSTIYNADGTIGSGRTATLTDNLTFETASDTSVIRMESDGTVDEDVKGFELVGTATGPYVQRASIGLDVYSNAGASPVGQAILFKITTDTVSTHSPMAVYAHQIVFNYAGAFTFQGTGTGNRLRFESTGSIYSTTNWLITSSSYTTADTAARLRISGIGTTSSNYGLKIGDSGGGLYFYARDDKRVGIGVDPADARVQIKGEGTTTGKALLVESSGGTDNFHVQDSGVCTGQAFQNNSSAPTVSYGAAAGTGPTTDLIQGGQNAVNIFFTTGTSPGASAAVFTINLPKTFANGCAASFVAYNAATQPLIGNFWLSGTSTNSITISYAGTLAATTAYALSITIFGF